MRREKKIAKLKEKNWRKWAAENMEPVSKHEIIMSGHIGSFLGVNIVESAWEIPLRMYERGDYKYVPRLHGFPRTRTRNENRKRS
jgi:hypothetical protein